MASRIPTRRSPVRSPGRSPGNSPGKSPGRDDDASPWKSKPQSPGRGPISVLKSSSAQRPTDGSAGRARGRDVVKKVTVQAPGKVMGVSQRQGHDDPTSRVGVRYLTEDLIKRTSREENMAVITSLNLTSTVVADDGRKIKYIENLDRLKNLHTLSLGYNAIEKIEKLNKLIRLRDLDLSYNNISKLEGLESLTMLQVLNMTGNNIEHIPPWFNKKLKALRVVKLAKNGIQSIQELTKLRPLRDLTKLTVAENPVSQLPHCRGYLIFHLRTLESLDDQPVTGKERTSAHNRFAQEELEQLQQQLEKQQEVHRQLNQEHNKSIGEIEAQHTKVKNIEQKSRVRDKQMKELQRELDAKNDLLTRKTSELTKACQKHYELEQELAFYKIDHKFESLARPPAPPSDSDNMAEDDGLVGDESPYLGKGRFKKNEMIRQRQLAQQAQQGVMGSFGAQKGMVGSLGADGRLYGEGDGLSYEEIQAKAQMNETMDRELDDKHNAIEGAKEKLHDLQLELQLTERQLQQATDELQKISEVSHGRPLTEDDKQDIRNLLGRKMDKVNHLRKTAQDIEQDIDFTRDDLNQQEREVGKLRGKLRRMGSRDSLYSLVKKEVSEKEKQLEMTAQQYQDLRHQLQGMLHTIARETEDIKNLEQDMREGQVSRNDEIREELEGVIQGLQAYLGDVQRKAEQQRDQYDSLVREKQHVEEQLREAARDRQLMEQQAQEIADLREKLIDLEDSILREQDLNDSLQNHLEESRVKEESDGKLLQHLRDTEGQMDKLRHALKSAEKKSQQEKEDYQGKLDSNQKKLDHLKGRAREANMKEDEIRNLHNQLTNLQISNAGLQDQVYDFQKKLEDEKKKALNPESLRNRLADITASLQSGHKTKTVRPGSQVDGATEADPVEEVLDEMEDKIHSELDKSFREVERARHDKDRAEADVMALRDKIIHVQDKEREMAEQAIQTMMDEERQESETLRRQIERLKVELERERELHKEHAQSLPPRLLEPSPKSQSRRSTTATATTSALTTDWSEEESSTIPSSQWSQKKQEIYDTMSPEEQDLFDELQGEIEELRRLLMMKGKDKEVVEKASQAAQTAALLRDMIETRQTPTDSQDTGSRSNGRKSGRHGTTQAGNGKAQTKEPSVQKVLKELDRAQDEIQSLQDQFHKRNAIAKEEMVHSDRTNHAITAQQEEIGQLHAVLQEQRDELEDLTEALDLLRGMRPGEATASRDQLRSSHRRRPSEDMGPPHYANRPHYGEQRSQRARDIHVERDRSGERRHGYDNRDKYRHGQPDSTMAWEEHRDRHAPERGRSRERHNDGGHRPRSSDRGRSLERPKDRWHGERRGRPTERSRSLDRMWDGWSEEDYHRDYPPHRDQMGRDYLGERRDYPAERKGPYSPARVPRGRPVPVFYSPDGQEIPFPDEDYYDRRQQYGPHGDGYMGATGQSFTAGLPNYRDAAGFSVDQRMEPINQAAGAPLIAGPQSLGPNQMATHIPGAPAFGGPQGGMGPQALGVQGASGPFAPPGQMGVPLAGAPVAGTPMVHGAGPAQGLVQPGMGAVAAGTHPNVIPWVAASAPTGQSLAPGAQLSSLPQVAPVMGQVPVPNTAPVGVVVQGSTNFNPHTPQGKGAVQVGFLPTTPIAGSTLGQMLSAPNTPGMSVVQPMMMSTPVAGDGVTGSPIKGILKKGVGAMDNMDDRLLCNVPEHHDLEDYIEQLQNKVKRLKSRLEEDQEESLEDSRRVLFEQDKEKQMVKRLKKELKDKRQELEGLDLAVEHQRSHLTKMKRQEERLKAKGKATRDELTRIQSGYPRTTHAKRQAFLDNEVDFDVSDSDYDYDYSSYEGRDQKSHIQKEILGLEDKLARRRAELRTADKLLTECERDLDDAQHKAKETIHKYQTAREGYKGTVKDLEDIELRARDSGSSLLKAKEQFHLIQLETEQLRQEKLQQEGTLKEIQIINNKEAEVKNLDIKVKQASKQLQDIEFELHSAEKDGDRAIMDRRKELELLQNKISEERPELERIRRQVAREQAEYDLTEEMLRKRRQLESTDKDLSAEVERRRKELKELDRQRGELQQERRKYDQELKQEESHLDRIHSEGQKRSLEVDTLQHKISNGYGEMDSLQNQRRSLEGAVSSLRSEKVSLEEDAKELHSKIGDLKRTQGRVESDIDSRHKQLSSLEQELRRVEQVLDTVTRGHSTMSQELQGVQTHIKDGRSDLEDVRRNLKGARANMHHLEQREEDQRSQSEGSYGNLEERLRNLAQEIINRETEKERLNSALERSCQELNELHRHVKKEREEVGLRLRHLEAEAGGLRQELTDRNKELHHLRKKTSVEIADLENIAQTHCGRANRLSDELSYLRAEYLEVKRKLDSQQEIVEREKRLENSIKDLKSDIKYEVADTILDQEKTKQETLNELGELQDQRFNMSSQLSNLKHSLSLMRSQDSGISLNVDRQTESFAEHQNFLKNQLASKMARQDKLLKAQRQISQENILNLQQKLTSLEQVFSQSDSLGANPVQDPAAKLAKSCDVYSAQPVQSPMEGYHRDENSSSQDSETREVPKRAYSPHRYSNNRTSWQHLSCDVPEKDAS